MQYKQLLLTVLVSVIYIGNVFGVKSDLPRVKQGVYDLSEVDLAHEKELKISGEWEFYWNTFLYEATTSKDTSVLKGFIEVPGLWNDHEFVAGISSSHGFATYRVTLLLKDKQPLALKYLNSATSCEIFIDGVSYYKAGIPGKTKEQTFPSYKPQTIAFIPQDTVVELVLQIANFHHRKGGPGEPISIGTQTNLIQQQNKSLFIELVLIGCIFIMWIFHLIIFFGDRGDKTSLYFAIFTLMVSIRLIVTGEVTAYMLGDINWQFLIRVDYLSFYWLSISFVFFINALYPKEVNRFFIVGTSILAMLFSLSVMLLPSTIFTYGIPYFQVISILGGLYLFSIIYKVVKYKREGAFHLLIGFAILFVCLVHDVLKENVIIVSTAITPYGLGIFILTQASLLSSRIRNALVNNTRLSDKLQQQNTEYLLLNEKYKVQNKQLVSAKEKAEQSDQFKSAFLANMSHEIRTPMNGILGFSELLSQKDFSQTERDEFIEIINERSHQLLGIVNDIIDITKIETGQIDIYSSKTPVNELLEALLKTYRNVAREKNLEINLFTSLTNQEAIVYADNIKLRQVLDNLMSNALKFTSEGGISFGYVHTGNTLKFFVRDSGIGLDEDEEKLIFGRFNQANGEISQLYGGTGLGLAIAKAYVNKMGGEMWIDSLKGKGSTFYFTLPYTQVNE